MGQEGRGQGWGQEDREWDRDTQLGQCILSSLLSHLVFHRPRRANQSLQKGGDMRDRCEDQAKGEGNARCHLRQLEWCQAIIHTMMARTTRN